MQKSKSPTISVIRKLTTVSESKSARRSTLCDGKFFKFFGRVLPKITWNKLFQFNTYFATLRFFPVFWQLFQQNWTLELVWFIKNTFSLPHSRVSSIFPFFTRFSINFGISEFQTSLYKSPTCFPTQTGTHYSFNFRKKDLFRIISSKFSSFCREFCFCLCFDLAQVRSQLLPMSKLTQPPLVKQPR